MQPILLQIGPVTIYSYGFFIAAALLIGLAFALRQARIMGLESQLGPELGFYLILASIVGARLLYVVLQPEQFLDQPLSILMFWEGGMEFFGGVAGAIAAGVFYLRRKGQPVWRWADSFAPGIALGLGVGRIGCFMAGCCYGKPTQLPWGVTFTHPLSLAPLQVPLHPTQLYHSLSGFLILLILLVTGRKLKEPGQLFGLFFVCYGVLRFVVEFYRDDMRAHLGALSLAQWAAIAAFLAGVGILYARRRT